jgi:DNA-binding GntR family transcriptional regulator
MAEVERRPEKKMADKRAANTGKIMSLDSELNPRRINRSSGLAEEVYKMIRADIMSLRIPPGTRILVDNLARELGVSQTPIREALSMLEAIGLVTKQHFIGYCAAPKFNSEQYKKLFEVRLLLEPYAARHAAQKMEEPMLETLQGLIAQMEPEGANGTLTSYERFADQDADFHARIAVGGGNDLIAEALDRLHTHLHIFRLAVHSEYAAEAKVEHARIALALTERDPDAAEAAMRAHIENSFQRLIPFIKD